MPRFVILEHDWPTTHWDFFLEAGPVLRAWRLLAEPAAGKEVPAEANAEHRLLYLDYEGPVSGDRGHVRRWDAGTFEWVADSPERIEVVLQGEKLAGRCVIEAEAHGLLSVGFH
jgi:DNA polymerase Ligase (LigD)